MTASTCEDLGQPLTDQQGNFNGTYACIVPRWQGVMIIGLYRMRFRVSNNKNAGVSDATKRVGERNREGFDFINDVRKANSLAEMLIPKHSNL